MEDVKPKKPAHRRAFLAAGLVLSACGLLAACFAVRFCKRRTGWASVAAAAVFALLFALNAVVCDQNSAAFMQTTVTSPPEGGGEAVFKTDTASGETAEYRRRFFFFAKERGAFPYAADGERKIQWLAPDVCAVTYQDGAGRIHQYVSANGDRGTGISYYYVLNAVWGGWGAADGSGWTITAENQKITLKMGDVTEVYSAEECVQRGTLALLLCRDGLPQWTLVLDENCRLEERTDLVEAGGTISLCKVSMDKTEPRTFARLSDPVEELLGGAA